MRWSPTIFALLETIVVFAETRVQYRESGLAQNSSNISIGPTGTYKILRADITQATVNVTTDNSSFQTSREDFDVVTQGIDLGALLVKCSAGWVSVFVTYPVIVPLSCTDPKVNVTLLQGEVWPEYGGFYLFVEYNGGTPAAWMVGDHLSSSPGWNFEPLTNNSWPPGGHWVWSGSLVIDQMPTLSLQDWMGVDFSDP